MKCGVMGCEEDGVSRLGYCDEHARPGGYVTCAVAGCWVCLPLDRNRCDEHDGRDDVQLKRDRS